MMAPRASNQPSCFTPFRQPLRSSLYSPLRPDPLPVVLYAPRAAVDAGGPQFHVVQRERGVVGRYEPRGRVVGLVVPVRVVLLDLAVVLEAAVRKLD